VICFGPYFSRSLATASASLLATTVQIGEQFVGVAADILGL